MHKSLVTLALGLGVAAAAPAATVQWADNGHWYEYVADNLTWQQALTAAAARTHLGGVGYLATATSAAENAFISSTVGAGALGWLSASDDGSEGSWFWQAGPETGQALAYSNWNAGEPNDVGAGEDYLQTNWAVAEGWNDHGGPGNAGQVNGYFVEFSATAVPEPTNLALVATALAAAALASRRRRTG